MEEEMKKFGVAKTQTLEEYYNEETRKVRISVMSHCRTKNSPFIKRIPQIGKNEIEIKQQMLKIIPPFKNWGNTGNH